MSETLATPALASFLDTFTDIYHELTWTRAKVEQRFGAKLGQQLKDRLLMGDTYSQPIEIVLAPDMVGMRAVFRSVYSGLPPMRATMTESRPKREARSRAEMQERCRHASHELCNALKRLYSPETTERVAYHKSDSERFVRATVAGRQAFMDALRQQLRRALYLQTGHFRLDLYPDHIRLPHEQGAWWIKPILEEETA